MTDRESPFPSRETLGRCFMDASGVIWEQVAYTEQPTASFRRFVNPAERLSIASGSLLMSKMKLLTEDEERDLRERVQRV